MNRLKKYNQRILAISGTLAILLLSICIISVICVFIDELEIINDSNSFSQNYEEERGTKERSNTENELLSYGMPILADTANLIYVIPVSLPRSYVSVSSDIFIHKDTDFENDYCDFSDEIKYHGNFINLMIYDAKKHISFPVFDQYNPFSYFEIKRIQSEYLVLSSRVLQDSNKDGLIDSEDLRQLNLFNINKRDLRKLSLDYGDVYSYEFINGRKDLLVNFGIDTNKDGMYQPYSEPTLPKIYSYEEDQIKEIIHPKLLKQQQDLFQYLENTKK